jgi:methyltransferase (TIGR00027 family)
VSELPSRTSVLVAAARAVGSRIDHPHWRNPDHLAIKLMGPAEREVIAGDPIADALERNTSELYRHPRVLGLMMTMLVRTKFIDEHLQQAIADGATQVVILGAGWDTRAYRFQEMLRDVKIFEVDRPALQAWKRRRMEEELGAAPDNLTYLQIDFKIQKLAGVMASSSYDPQQKTFFIWEGVTMYLPEDAVRETLRWVASQAPGSTIVFDFADSSVIDFMRRVDDGFEPTTEYGRLAAQRANLFKEWNEPWLFGIPEGGSVGFVGGLGLEHRETLAMASVEAAKRYLGWDRDVPYSSQIRMNYSILSARVP